MLLVWAVCNCSGVGFRLVVVSLFDFAICGRNGNRSNCRPPKPKQSPPNSVCWETAGMRIVCANPDWCVLLFCSVFSCYYVLRFSAGGHMEIFLTFLSRFFSAGGHMEVFLTFLSHFFSDGGHMENFFSVMSRQPILVGHNNNFLFYMSHLLSIKGLKRYLFVHMSQSSL